MLKRVGVYPLRDHYYEPLFNDGHLSVDLAQPRKLPGIDFRLAEQIAFLKTLRFQDEFGLAWKKWRVPAEEPGGVL